MSILVTGGAGYIGSHTCAELLKSGEDVVILDNFCNSKVEIIPKIRELGGKDFPVYAADLTHYDAVERVFRTEKIESVIHFAGLKAVGESVEKPLEYYDNNVTGTLNLLRVMRRYDCKKIVFSSSATVYGPVNPAPYEETMPTSATNPYGETKVVIENILKALYAADNEWSIALLRYFNPIGAHGSGLIGENPNGIPNNLLPYIMRVAVRQLPKLRVFGDDYPTPDGTGIRDYIHVCDLAEGHLAALKHVREHKGAEAFNLGSGKGYSVLEVVRAFEKASGVEIPYEIAPRRAGDLAEVYANTEKSARVLDCVAKRDLDDMCRDAWGYIKGASV